MAGGGEDSFIVPLGILLGSTALVALLLSYAKQSTIVAFIFVGVAVSSVEGVEYNDTTLGHISEVGILILLFMAGLEVELGAFIRKWKTVTIIGVGQIVCSTGFFALSSIVVLPAIGAKVTTDSAVYFGLCMCFSSTILVLGYLKNTKSMGTVYGQLCLGTLVLQDAASVLGIAVLTGLTSGDSVAISILVLFGKLIAACFICFLLERYVLRKMFEAFARSLELLYLGSLGYATGLAAIAVTCGFSGEITAFLAGVSLAQLPYKMHIETKMEPIKSLGVAIFFISLGLKLELNQKMVESLPIGFALAIFTLFATLPLFMGLGFLAKLKSHNVFMLGLLMNQISEFSLILCTLCVRAGVFEPIVLTVMTVAAVVSIIISSIGHTFIDVIYQKIQRRRCMLCIDARYRGGFPLKHDRVKGASKDLESGEIAHSSSNPIVDPIAEDADNNDEDLGSEQAPSLLHSRPTGTDVEDWAFEDQLPNRSTEQLEIDLEDYGIELESARNSMAATADEKRLNTKKRVGSKGVKIGNSFRGNSIMTSYATDIRHGMIEGYVIMDQNVMYCTLRAGRMLFWKDRLDVGHAPPISVWDISVMTIKKMENKNMPVPMMDRKSTKEPGDTTEPSRVQFSDSESTDDDMKQWDWTIVLGHIHRNTGTSSIEEDTVKLAIHGLENYTDHDAQDWQDALAVATDTLNPTALRLTHIRKELSRRRNTTIAFHDSLANRKAAHRNQIICIGYNKMFRAVIALADALHKEVVVVEYDPMKINTVKKLYNEEKRRQDFNDKKRGKVIRKAHTTDEIGKLVDIEKGTKPKRHRRMRSKSTPINHIKEGFWAEVSKDLDVNKEVEIKGVACEYADIHDPECWEELEMDKAFMVVCIKGGARHAEKAIIKWLKKQKSRTKFVTFTQTNTEALKLYKAGAHFVMQTDALAMRSTREIFIESVANIGDCTQLVAAGLSHRKRLIKLENENKLKFLYETG